MHDLFNACQCHAQHDKDAFSMPLIGDAAPEFTAQTTNGTVNFPADYAAAFAELQRRGGALAELLPKVVPADAGRMVAISGIDYATLRLTDRSHIEAV